MIFCQFFNKIMILQKLYDNIINTLNLHHLFFYDSCCTYYLNLHDDLKVIQKFQF